MKRDGPFILQYVLTNDRTDSEYLLYNNTVAYRIQDDQTLVPLTKEEVILIELSGFKVGNKRKREDEQSELPDPKHSREDE